MRHVAATFVALLILASVPGTAQRLNAYDDCDSPVVPGSPAPNTDKPCLRIDPPAQTGAKRTFVYAAAAKCAPAFEATCSGRPANGAVLGIVGIVYQDTNGYAGLQRLAQSIEGTRYVADTMVLV